MPFNPNEAQDFVSTRFTPEAAQDFEQTVPSGPNKGLTKAQLEQRLRQQEQESGRRRAELSTIENSPMTHFAGALDLLGSGASLLTSPFTGAVDLAADALRGPRSVLGPKRYGGSYEKAMEAHVRPLSSSDNRLLMRDVVGALSDDPNTVHSKAGFPAPLTALTKAYEGGMNLAERGAEAIGLDPMTGRNVANVGLAALDIAGLRGATGAGRAAGVADELSDAERAAFNAREATGVVSDTLPTANAKTPLGLARELDFKITPAYASIQPERVGMAQTGIFKQRIAGPAFNSRFQVENQQIANMRAAEDIGVDPNIPLSQSVQVPIQNFANISQEIADVLVSVRPDQQFMQEVNSLGARLRENPALAADPGIEALRLRLAGIERMNGQQLLDAIRTYRHDAGIYFKSLDDPNKHAVGHALRDAADLVEGLMVRQLEAGGLTDLATNFQNARVAAAKAHDIQNALVGDNVDIGYLGRVGGDRLTGRLQDMARIAEEFPELTRHQSKIRPDQGAMSLAFSPITLGTQRAFGRNIVEHLLGDEFQNAYGRFNPLRYSNENPPPPRTMASQATGGSDPFGFTPDGNVPPAAPFRGGGGAPELELVPDDVPGGEQLPPAANRPGDLTAEQVPPTRGDIDFTPEPRSLSSELELAPESGTFPGAEVPPEAAVTEFVTNAPVERRRTPTQPYLGIERRFPDGTPDLTAERQRVLDRPVGTPANEGLPDQLLSDPKMRAAARQDTLSNRLELVPEDQMPPPLSDREMLDLGLADADFDLRFPPRRPPDEPTAPVPVAPRTPPKSGEGGAEFTFDDIDPDLPEGAGLQRGPMTSNPNLDIPDIGWSGFEAPVEGAFEGSTLRTNGRLDEIVGFSRADDSTPRTLSEELELAADEGRIATEESANAARLRTRGEPVTDIGPRINARNEASARKAASDEQIANEMAAQDLVDWRPAPPRTPLERAHNRWGGVADGQRETAALEAIAGRDRIELPGGETLFRDPEAGNRWVSDAIPVPRPDEIFDDAHVLDVLREFELEGHRFDFMPGNPLSRGVVEGNPNVRSRGGSLETLKAIREAQEAGVKGEEIVDIVQGAHADANRLFDANPEVANAKTVGELFDMLTDDRAHGDEALAEAARELRDQFDVRDVDGYTDAVAKRAKEIDAEMEGGAAVPAKAPRGGEFLPASATEAVRALARQVDEGTFTPEEVADAVANNPQDFAPELVKAAKQAIRSGDGGKLVNLLRQHAGQESSGAAPAKSSKLFIRRGGKDYPVKSLEDAADKWDQFRDRVFREGGSSDDHGGGVIVRDQSGKPVGWISPNGRIWEPGSKNFDFHVRHVEKMQQAADFRAERNAERGLGGSLIGVDEFDEAATTRFADVSEAAEEAGHLLDHNGRFYHVSDDTRGTGRPHESDYYTAAEQVAAEKEVLAILKAKRKPTRH